MYSRLTRSKVVCVRRATLRRSRSAGVSRFKTFPPPCPARSSDDRHRLIRSTAQNPFRTGGRVEIEPLPGKKKKGKKGKKRKYRSGSQTARDCSISEKTRTTVMLVGETGKEKQTENQPESETSHARNARPRRKCRRGVSRAVVVAFFRREMLIITSIEFSVTPFRETTTCVDVDFFLSIIFHKSQDAFAIAKIKYA